MSKMIWLALLFVFWKQIEHEIWLLRVLHQIPFSMAMRIAWWMKLVRQIVVLAMAIVLLMFSASTRLIFQ